MLRQNSKLISQVIDDYVKECNLEDGIMRARIFEAWDLLLLQMGGGRFNMAEAASLTISKSFKDGVLNCKISSSVIRTQLRFSLPQMKEKMNTMLQTDCVKEIKIW